MQSRNPEAAVVLRALVCMLPLVRDCVGHVESEVIDGYATAHIIDLSLSLENVVT